MTTRKGALAKAYPQASWAHEIYHNTRRLLDSAARRLRRELHDIHGLANAGNQHISRLALRLDAAHEQPLAAHVAEKSQGYHLFEPSLEMLTDDPRMISEVLALDKAARRR